MASRFQKNRQRLAEQVGEQGVAVVFAATETVRNYDVTHPFRQDSDFFWLTGFDEPESVAVLAPGAAAGDFILFVRPRDREMEIWNGYRAGVEGARERFGADQAFSLDELDGELTKLSMGRRTLYVRPENQTRLQGAMGRLASHRDRLGSASPATTSDLGRLIGDLRLRKTEDEQASLRAACDLSAEGHLAAMRQTRPGLYEYQVAAKMEYIWRMGGSVRDGYPSIVASGPNACVLHYVENQRRLEEGDLLLIDAACEVDYFSSDITRTFPVGATYSAPQRAVYEVVLAAQRAAIETCRPGSTTNDQHETAKRVLTEGLVELGLLPRSVEDSLAMHHYREFFMHGTGHWLGMDVHDAGAYRVDGRHRALEPGMAFTVEPGLYFDPERESVELPLLEYDQDAWAERRILQGTAAAKKLEEEEKETVEMVTHPIPAEFRGIGVRIEDDILITSNGHENLTATVPVDPSEIEAIRAEALG